MKRFRFQLEPLLRLRHHAEEACKRALGEAMSALEQAHEKKRQLEKERDEIASQSLTETEYFNQTYRLQVGFYLSSLEVRIDEGRVLIGARENDVKKRTDDLNRAVQQRKMLERLKDRRRDEFRVATGRADQVALDEHATHFLRREGGLFRLDET